MSVVHKTTATYNSEYAHLSAGGAALAAAVKAEFTANGWNPSINSISWDDTITATSSAQLRAWLTSGTAIGGVVPDPANRNQRVRLDSAGTWTWANQNQIDCRARDWQINGKVCLIEPLTTSPQITSRFRVLGSRGLYIRNLDFVGSCTDYGLDITWAPYTVASVAITSGGTGYTAGDTLTGTGGTKEAACTLHVDTVSSGVVTAVSISYGGKLLTVAPTGWSGGTGSGFTATATLQGSGGSPRDTQTFIVDRTSSFPLLSSCIVDNCRFGPEFKTSPVTDPLNYPTAMGGGNIEQVYVLNCLFKGYETGISISTGRHVKIYNNDFQRGIGDAVDHFNTNSTTVIGAGTVYSTVYPDKLVYTWSKFNTLRNMVDACATLNSQGEDVRMDQEHTDFLQHGSPGDDGSYTTLEEYNMSYEERITYQDRNGSIPAGSTSPTVRVNGGCQGMYLDDAGVTFNIDNITHSNTFVMCAFNAFTTYNGTSYVERNTGTRVGNIAPSATTVPDGFNYPQDPYAWITIRQKAGATGAVANILNNICSALLVVDDANFDAPTTYNPSGNVIADTRKAAIGGGSAMSDIFSGTFTTDGEGRQSYTFLDDGSNTPAQFRTALHAQFTPKAPNTAKGALDPATWPAT